MTNMILNTDVAEASTSDRDDAVPVVESRKAGPLTWGEDSPRGGRVVMNRALREDATVPLFLAQTLIQSLRDVGYDSTISALCEHVDNAIGAGAKNVRVYIRQTGKGSSVRTDIAVLDDGAGMSPQILKVATSFGGSTNYNNRSGIGRFGMGMKTAGLSMAPAIQILSWQERGIYYRMTLDTDAIGRDKSNLIILPEPALQEDIGAEQVQLVTVPMRYPSDASEQRLLASRGSNLADALGASGTIIYMPDCDRLSAKRDRTLVDHATKDFAHVYRRHIARGLKIYVNNRLLEAVDPTYSMENARHTRHPALRDIEAKTSRLIVKRKCSVFPNSSSSAVYDVTIKLYALPIRDWRFTRKTLDDIGIFQDQTISILRNDREVFLGHLTALLKRHSDLAWLRIEIDFPGELDEAFGVASNKQGVRLREDVIDGIWKVIKDDVAVVREDIREVQARNAIERRGGSPSTAESKANEADPFQAHSLDDNLTDAERADMEKNIRALAIGLRREGESEEDAFTRIQASKYVIHYKNDRFWPFYEVEYRYGRVILTINTAHPFYDRLYRPLAELALKPTSDGGEDREVTAPASESPLAVVLDLLLLSLARTQSVMGASKEVRPTGELFEDMRREWSDTLKKQIAA